MYVNVLSMLYSQANALFVHVNLYINALFLLLFFLHFGEFFISGGEITSLHIQ